MNAPSQWEITLHCNVIPNWLDVYTSGIILWMRPANERWGYIVTSSLIGWAHTQHDPHNICLCAVSTRQYQALSSAYTLKIFAGTPEQASCLSTWVEHIPNNVWLTVSIDFCGHCGGDSLIRIQKDMQCIGLFHGLTLNNGEWVVLPIWWW